MTSRIVARVDSLCHLSAPSKIPWLKKIAIIETLNPRSRSSQKKQAYVVTFKLSGMILESIGVVGTILPQINTTFEQISLCDGDYPGVVEFHLACDLWCTTGKLPAPKEALG
jgi:2-octaprenyl-6-methoxyphenol hydroxylase